MISQNYKNSLSVQRVNVAHLTTSVFKGLINVAYLTTSVFKGLINVAYLTASAFKGLTWLT